MSTADKAPRWALAVLLVLCLAALDGCSEGDGTPPGETASEDASEAAEPPNGKADGGEPGTEEKPKKPRKERSTSVKASPVVRADLVVPIVAEGSIRARHVSELKFELSENLVRLYVEEGQRVEKGQRLAGLDDREIRLALEEANSRYLKALGQLAVEEDGFSSRGAERGLSEQTAELLELERRGVITHQQRLDRELDLGMEAMRKGAYRRELMEVRSGLASARADMDRFKLNLERTVIKAPFDGVVTGLDVTQGVQVRAGDTLCRLVDDVNVEAEVGVIESDLGFLEPGRRAYLSLPALARTVPVTVDVVSPDIDTRSRTCSVLMRLTSDGGRIKPGMFVRAAIAGQTFKDRLLVPREAIVTRDGRPVLFKVDEKRAHWVYVKLGERNDALVEIQAVLQGGPLEPGTLVVVDNHLTLTHEAKVKIKKKLPITDPWAAGDETG